MRVGILGSGGLACLLANCIEQETSHSFLLIAEQDSNTAREAGLAVHIIDPRSEQSISYALLGLDVVVATHWKYNTEEWINRFAEAGSRRFIPSYHEGLPLTCDPLCAHCPARARMQQLLDDHKDSIESTMVVCGVLFERFHKLSYDLLDISDEAAGTYPIDAATMTALLPENGPDGERIVNITAAQDLVRFLARILDAPAWPSTYCISSERVSLQRLLSCCETARSQRFTQVSRHTVDSMRSALRVALRDSDVETQRRIHHLLAMSKGHVSYSENDLASLFPEVERIRSMEWLVEAWTD